MTEGQYLLLWAGFVALALVVKGQDSSNDADRFFAGYGRFYLVFVLVLLLVGRLLS